MSSQRGPSQRWDGQPDPHWRVERVEGGVALRADSVQVHGNIGRRTGPPEPGGLAGGQQLVRGAAERHEVGERPGRREDDPVPGEGTAQRP